MGDERRVRPALTPALALLIQMQRTSASVRVSHLRNMISQLLALLRREDSCLDKGFHLVDVRLKLAAESILLPGF